MIKLRDIQHAKVDISEVILSTSKMVFELCCTYSGTHRSNEDHSKALIEAILTKYKERCDTIAVRKEVQESDCSDNGANSEENIDEVADEVNSREVVVGNGV